MSNNICIHTISLESVLYIAVYSQINFYLDYNDSKIRKTEDTHFQMAHSHFLI